MDPLTLILYFAALVINLVAVSLILFFRKKIRPISLILVALILAFNVFFIYSTLIEPASFEVNHYPVKIFHETDDSIKFTIALVADFHVNSIKDKNFLGEVVSKLNEIDADYIVICGDMIDYSGEEIPLLEPLLDIEDKTNTLVVLGNHDYGMGWNNVSLANDVALWFKSNGFTVLRNQNMVHQVHQKDNIALCFAGVDSLWSRQIDLDEAYDNLDPNCTTILISHNPDVIFLLDDERVDLMISGHTHGGQVCLPVIGAPWIPSKIKEGCGRGLYEINDRKLFITKGIMGSIRFNAKPEIAIIELS